ncbi:MAG: decarboxylating 6-phosphogluconate dehydrogenase [Bacteroidales bacterium]|nr:decarboxylating 6-phosphogluconate dehydrogenase [Bacteroidales bacterium]MDT8374265.1 decarboxylating 6-phosphogluconate dehydrogenase [Bacteroidales bacterium]
MKLGFIGLGKMGRNMVQRLLNGGHEVVVYDRSPEAVNQLVANGASGSDSLEELTGKLDGRKIVWLMVPSGKPVDDSLAQLLDLLSDGDIIIDGGNSNYKDTQERAARASARNIHFLDCGTSGGVWGLENGYSLMSGGNREASEYVYPIFRTLAPENGYTYCGESGAGHFVKMIHNGIEYGMMQSIAEGFEIMERSPYKLDLTAIASGWQYSSVVRSWLLELIVRALKEDPKLDELKDYVEDSGEGRWTIQAAMDLNVPAHVITAALYTRFQSRQEESFAMKVLAALRNQFGGHSVKKK